MSRVLYLGQAIDRVSFEGRKQIVADVASISMAASTLGWLVYRPFHAWMVSPDTEPGPELEAVNRAVLEHSGAFIGVSHEAATVGLWRELEMARALEIPSVLLGANPTWSLTDAHLCADLPAVLSWLEKAGRPVPEPLDEPEPESVMMVPFAQADSDHLGALPSRSYPGDAGFDLYSAESVEIAPGQFQDVACGVRCALPPGVWGRITGRSSTLRKRGLMVAEGVIDSGHRGPLFAGVWNLGTNSVRVEAGERIAQMLLHINVARVHEPVWLTPDEFDGLPGDGRGASGFGSTGR